MKKLVIGILAHVDAGKTTLSEALLYQSGSLRKLGRVDHQDAFLDNFDIERERGITVFSKQAILPLGDTQITLLDTPGHVDFSAETERTLQVLDCAILVISAADGVQAHTRTLWRLLERYGVPTFLFINKMDLPNRGAKELLSELKSRLDDGCVDFTQSGDSLYENIATCGEAALDCYLENGTVPDEEISALIAKRKLFPCFFGSALKLEGVEKLTNSISHLVHQPHYPTHFSAKVYKISRDTSGARLTWMKITGGSLKVKSLLTNRRAGLADEAIWEEKADQLRLYSGPKFTPADEVSAGSVCAVTGLTRTRPGMGLGGEPDSEEPILSPVLTYRLLLPDGVDPHTAFPKLAQLEEEDPMLRIVWEEGSRQLHVQLMGEVQLEIIQRLIADRFGWAVTFGEGAIVYRETIAAPAVGIGHYEPLRHYAEAHLLLEPLERGAGLHFGSLCSEDVLARNWQRLILTHLEEKVHRGVLTGSPITDMRISIVAGRSHAKHTEGGDFRQATWRAVRQALMGAESVLLEPWYDFRLELPTETVGRAMSDLQRMNGTIDNQETLEGESVLIGRAPVSELRDYAAQVTAYTRGQGRLMCTLRGYDLCHNSEEVIAQRCYQPEHDLLNPADSVFCSHGAGVNVKWDEVPAHAHVDSGLRLGQKPSVVPPQSSALRRSAAPVSGAQLDKELEAIFEKAYGPIKGRGPRPMETPVYHPDQRRTEKSVVALRQAGPEYLLVDGYNIIFAWEDLKALARDSLEGARQQLMDILCNYQGWRGCHVILVFDAYKVPHGTGEVEQYHNIHVVYTKEAETADSYIEKATFELSKGNNRVTVATSDSVEQLIILGHGALRISARSFREEVEQARVQMESALAEHNRHEKSPNVKTALEQAGWKPEA